MSPDSTTQTVHALLRERAPLAQDRFDLSDDLPLGPGGLGLDSIALVELLIECERRFGIPRPTDLLEVSPLTVGRLVSYVRDATGA